MSSANTVQMVEPGPPGVKVGCPEEGPQPIFSATGMASSELNNKMPAELDGGSTASGTPAFSGAATTAGNALTPSTNSSSPCGEPSAAGISNGGTPSSGGASSSGTSGGTSGSSASSSVPKLAERLTELKDCQVQGLLSPEEHSELRSNELQKFKEFGSQRSCSASLEEREAANTAVVGVNGLSQLVPLLKGLVQVLGHAGAYPPGAAPAAPPGALPCPVQGAPVGALADTASPQLVPGTPTAPARPHPPVPPSSTLPPAPGPSVKRPRWRIRGKQRCESSSKRPRAADGQADHGDCHGHYDELRVRRSATAYEVRAAYRQRCLETHPDKTYGDSAPFVRVNKAFTVLSDKDQRAAYDSEIQVAGSPDGLSAPDSAWAVQLMQRVSDTPQRARLLAARHLHIALLTRPQCEWHHLLARADVPTLEAMASWMGSESALPVRQKGAAGPRLPPVAAPCIHLSSHGTRYDIRIQFETYLLIANSTADLAIAVDRCVALTRIREIWMEKRPTSLALEDVMSAVQFEPTIHVKVCFKKAFQGRRISSPILLNVLKALQLHDVLRKSSTGPGAARRVENIMKTVRMELEMDKKESEDMDERILQTVMQAIETRGANQRSSGGEEGGGGQGGPRGQPQQLALCPPVILVPPAGEQPPGAGHHGSSGSDAGCGSQNGLRSFPLLHGEPLPVVLGPPLVPPMAPIHFMDSGAVLIFGLSPETADRLLGFLQVFTLCRLQMVSRRFSHAISPKSRQRVACFVYTPDSLESVVYSQRGRRMTPKPEEAKSRLIRFLSQPEHGPLFRYLDLHQAPMDALQDVELHGAIRHMTRLTRLIYPNIGWTNIRLRADFLATVNRGATKEGVMPLGRT